jgi:hypothetical protein
MPQIVSGLITGMRIRVPFLVMRIDDVAYGGEIIDFAGRTKGDVIGLGFTETPGQGKLCLIGHILIRKAQQGVLIHGIANRSNIRVGQCRRQIDADYTGAKKFVQGFEVELTHLSSQFTAGNIILPPTATNRSRAE